MLESSMQSIKSDKLNYRIIYDTLSQTAYILNTLNSYFKF